jgi:hypothetical protein
MDTALISNFLYPYPYQTETRILFLLIILAIGLPTYGIYRLIIWKMNESVKAGFHRILILGGMILIAIFLADVIVSSITQYQVNRQLGFRYATPDTPEGELFVITKVTRDKTMDKAGIIPGDEVQMNGVSDLYKLLINNQGKEVLIPILRDKKKMMINVRVPVMYIPLKEISYIIF